MIPVDRGSLFPDFKSEPPVDLSVVFQRADLPFNGRPDVRAETYLAGCPLTFYLFFRIVTANLYYMESIWMSPEFQEIQAILRERRNELAQNYGVAEIGVFGSCVRGDASADSDIDILVEFERPVGFFKFLELEEKLSEWLGGKVDLVTKAALKPRIGRRILSEVTML
jgi:predicted nucleotidyltransferase